MEWSALFLEKNDKPIKFDDDYFDQDINDLKYVNDLDKWYMRWFYENYD